MWAGDGSTRRAARPSRWADLAAAAAAAAAVLNQRDSGLSAQPPCQPCSSHTRLLLLPQQVLDPATGKPIARVPNCGGAETRQAIAAAEIQFKEWGQRPGKERATILRRWPLLAGGCRWSLVCGNRELAARAAAASRALCFEGAAALRYLGRLMPDLLPDLHWCQKLLRRP